MCAAVVRAQVQKKTTFTTYSTSDDTNPAEDQLLHTRPSIKELIPAKRRR